MIAPAPAARPEDVLAGERSSPHRHPGPQQGQHGDCANDQPHQQRVRVGHHSGGSRSDLQSLPGPPAVKVHQTWPHDSGPQPPAPWYFLGMPHRAPGSPGHGPGHYLQGKQIRYYRPAGSADVRQLIEGAFQAFSAGRLSEACHIYADKMLAPASDTTIGLTVAGALTPAGLGGCVIELMERGLIDFMISTGANLYHDLHYALNFQLHRGSPFLDDVDLYEQGIIRIYDVLFPATVLLETDAYIRGFLVRSGLHGPIATSEFHYRLGLDLLERNPACAEYSVVAKAAQCGLPIYTSSPGDSSIGMNIAFHEPMHGRPPVIDPTQGVQQVRPLTPAGHHNATL